METKNTFTLGRFEPLCLIRWFLRDIWLVILAALIGQMAVDALLVTDFSRSYSCATTFVVAPQDGSSYYSSISASTAAASDYANMLESDVMRLILWEAMGTEAPASVSATQLGETNMIRVTVTADDPKSAMTTIQALTENYHVLAEYVSTDSILNVFNTPNVSIQTSSSYDHYNLRRYAAFGCGAAMAALMLWMFINCDTVQTSQGAKLLLDAKVIGSIPHDSKLSYWFFGFGRKHRHQNITSPGVNFGFSESIHRIASTLEQEKIKGNSVFLFTSVSESEGKSTVAANTALSLASKDNKVLLIDLDLRRPVLASILGLSPTTDNEFGFQLETGASAQAVLSSAMVEPSTNLHALINRKAHPEALDLLSMDLLRAVLTQAKHKYHFIIVDLPPIGYFSDSELLGDLCDASVLVVRQDRVRADVLNDVVDTLRACRGEFLGCVLNDMAHLLPSQSGYGYGYSSKYGYGKYGYTRKKRQTGKQDTTGR